MGRHRGKYTFKLPWPRGIFSKGLHRGVYEPKPWWNDLRPRFPLWEWERSVTLPLTAGQISAHTFTLAPPRGGIGNLPALFEPLSREEVRDVVRDELAATPIFTGLKYGRFGDSEFDLASPAPVCPPLSA